MERGWGRNPAGSGATHIFDVGARVNRDDIAMLDPQVVTNDTVDPDASIVQLIVSQDNQDGVLSLLSSDEDCVTTEQLQLLHGVVG
jgi:hypothetical protein